MSRSLRLRMFLIILLPLVLLALAVGVWRLFDAKRTAEELFDKDLLFATSRCRTATRFLPKPGSCWATPQAGPCAITSTPPTARS